MTLPQKVKIVEVGPRDGLQNESQKVTTETKIEFINQLSQTGLQSIEVTSFVSPQWIPQMADNKQVLAGITRHPNITYSALIPNEQGMLLALNSNLNEIGIFTAASETFCYKNINCSIEESLGRYEKVIAIAKQYQIPIRAYISCVLGCPYEGEVLPEKVALIAQRLVKMGCYEISLGDTIGIGTPNKAKRLIEACAKQISIEKLAAHFHDTYGQALVNIYAVLQQGIHIFDSSVAGLGGCPYAKGASGNVATEDLVYLLEGLDIKTGIDLNQLITVGEYICNKLKRVTRSKVSLAKLNSSI